MSDPTRSPSNATPVFLAPAQGAQVLNVPNLGDYLVLDGPGYLSGLYVNTPADGASLTLYDGTDTDGVVLGVWDISRQGALALAIPFAVGLYVAAQPAPGACNLTLTYVPG